MAPNTKMITALEVVEHQQHHEDISPTSSMVSPSARDYKLEKRAPVTTENMLRVS
jgi:hypothetical protein